MRTARNKSSRKAAEEIFRAAVSAASPYDSVRSNLKLLSKKLKIYNLSLDLKSIKNIYLIGAGKAACPMAKAVEDALGSRIKAGCVVTKYNHALKLKYAEVIEAGHPLPDRNGLKGAQKILEIARSAGQGDLVIFLLSGGASALLPAPVEGLSLKDKKRLTGLLIGSGASIQEINTVRKHLSRIKGGRLMDIAYPARVITLIVSDVVNDDISSIASGPTAPDPSTYTDALDVIKRYGLLKKAPPKAISFLKMGASGAIVETPKPGEKVFKNCENIIIVNNSMALRAAKEKASSLGYRSLVLSSTITGPARKAAGFFTSILKEAKKNGNPLRPPCCIIMGGETVVEVRGTGLGGRNQELALASAIGLEGSEGITVLSAGTDGTDGPTEAAGAFADCSTVQRGRSAGLDVRKYLDDNDSYRFFKKLKDLFITGPTGTNVMDIAIGLVE
ncbi:MAG: glycerate kinase [Deltaproteobacteria bacterium]|nr:glycerate kinase [Deltaproteobacteria bacterium]